MTTNQETACHHLLLDKWDLYYHLPQDKNWEVSTPKIIMRNIDSVEKLYGIVEALPHNLIKHCMLFIMRSGISPMWEDPANKNGGRFSYKVVNKYVVDVWKSLFYSLCGGSLCVVDKYSHLLNGITISPKKNFCIIKIWMRDCSIQDPSIILNIPNLTKQGVSFRKHDD